MTAEKQWAELSPEEKREERFKKWLSPDVKFSSPQAEKAYQARLTRIIDAIKLREPDRVPVNLPAGYFPTYYAGITLQKAMYDYDALSRAWLKFMRDFDTDMDTFGGPGFVFPGRVSELLDTRTSKWPGHGLPDDARFHQFVEGEYMKADEYDVPAILIFYYQGARLPCPERQERDHQTYPYHQNLA